MTIVGSVVKCLECRDCDQHGLGQNLLRHSVESLGKTLYGTFFCLMVLASSSKFQSFFYKTKKKQNKNFNRTAMSWHLRKRVGVIACPMY